MTDEAGLRVAVTGPTGTFGAGLVPLLLADERIAAVTGIARRPFDPAERGWVGLDYRQGDVRDVAALASAFEGADVVVHLAFLITGAGGREVAREINIDGTLNAFRAAAEAGCKRFVYASSVSAYGFFPDNPIGVREDWPVRPANRLFYAQEKAELEQALESASATWPAVELYVLRPSIVAGPNFLGAKQLPGPFAPLNGLVTSALSGGVPRLPVPLPVVVPGLEMQLVHEADVGQALVQCAVGAGPAGAYNIAADGVVTLADVARALGARPIELPERWTRAGARLATRIPQLPAFAEWVDAATYPAIMDTTKAKTQLGWAPRFTAQETLEASIAG